MRKSLSLFAISILGILGLIIPFITLMAFKPLHQQNYSVNQQTTGMNETDFINTMFLRSSFFENWSETNYFINPVLKTSQTLTYNDKWYLDFLKDSYSTGISFDKPSDEFMDLYKNGDTYAKQYDIDKKQFLKELTNFFYSFALMIEELLNFKIMILNVGNNSVALDSEGYSVAELYRGDGVLEPITLPLIDANTGKVIFYTDDEYQNVRSFLLKYINAIVQENIRVQQSGNPNYNDPNLGSQRIIFDFEIINNMEKLDGKPDVILTRKSIYRMILTIDENKNIVAGSLELTHFKHYWDGNNANSYQYTDDLGFLFSFMKEKNNIFNFSAETYNYNQSSSPNTNKYVFEQMKGQIDINKFLKFFLLMLWYLCFKIAVILLKVIILIIYNMILF